MRAAAILGPGNTGKALSAFQRGANAQWTSLVEQADAIIVFGGDGTIHRNLPVLVDLAVPVLVVPCGSGNDFARALGLRGFRDSIEAWRSFIFGTSNVRTIDLGVIRPMVEPGVLSIKSAERHCQFFCCVAGVGLDAEVTRRANSLPRWLRAYGGYALSAPREFLHFEPLPMSISRDSHTSGTFQPTTLVAVANSPTYGGGMKIAPNAKLDDGKLDLCIVRAIDKLKLFCLFPTVYFGRHLELREVEYAQAEAARVESKTPLDVYADGEYVCQTPVEFSVAANALQVIVPDSLHSRDSSAKLTNVYG